MRLLLFVVGAVSVTACSGPHSSPAGADASADATTDGSASGSGSGSCAGADLDHDNLGWSCDPVESVDVPFIAPANSIPRFSFAGQRDVFGGLVTYRCNSSFCDAIVAVSAAGSSFARTDSGLPADAWLASGDLVGPYAGSDGELLWSRGFVDGDIGRLDLVNGGYTAEGSGAVYNSVHAGENGTTELIAAWNNGGPDTNVYAAASDSLVTVDGAAAGVTSMIAGHGFVSYDARTPGGPNGMQDSLHVYLPGDPAASIVSLLGQPATGLDQLLPLVGGPAGTASYCARRGSEVTYVQMTAAGAHTDVSLPFADHCYLSYQFVGATLYIWTTNGNQMSSAAFIRNGVLTMIFSDNTPSVTGTIVGDGLQVFLAGAGTSSARAWAVTPTNEVIQLGADLLNLDASVYGNTAAVVGLRATTNGFAELVADRWRASSGTQRVTITSSVPASTMPSALVTAEEAVIAESGGINWAIPSASSTPVALDLRYKQVAAARNGHTFILAQTSAPTSQPAGYAYDEVGGVPRITQIVPPLQGRFAEVLDSRPGQSSEWYLIGGGVCLVARVVTTAGVPSLESLSCSNPALYWPTGERSPDAAGHSFVVVGDGLYMLGPDGGREVARGTDLEPLVDETTNAVIGWSGNDAVGGYVCMAAHPDRCWSVAPAQSNAELFSVLWVGPDQTFTAARWRSTAAGATVTIVRTLDSGNRPQPLL